MAEEKKPAAVTPSQFRLSKETRDDLDCIAADRTAETGVTHTRTDAVSYAARKEAERVRKKKSGK